MEALHRVFRKREDILDRKVAGETFLVPVRGKLADLQRIFALNPVAEFIWSKIDGRQSLAQIAAAIAEEFEVDEAKAKGDIVPFVTALSEANLITEVAEHERAG